MRCHCSNLRGMKATMLASIVNLAVPVNSLPNPILRKSIKQAAYHRVAGHSWLKVGIAEAAFIYSLCIMRQVSENPLLTARIEIA